MTGELNVMLSMGSAVCLLGVAAFALARERSSVMRASFTVGMFVLALDSVFAALSIAPVAGGAGDIWIHLRFATLALIPGTWLVFALTYGRADPSSYLRRWRFPLAALFLVPLACALFFGTRLVSPPADAADPTHLRLGPAGILVTAVCLVGLVMVAMNLERTLRASTGTMRWRIKFMVLGLGVILAARIYELTQALLYSSLVIPLIGVTAGATIVGAVLTGGSLLRSRIAAVDLYLSGTVLFRSLTVLFLGVYLLVVGILAEIAARLGRDSAFPIKTLVLFLAFALLGLVCLSDRLRQRVRRLVSRHFRRPQYDHRKVWTQCYELTAHAGDRASYCRAVAATVSRTFDILSVSVWVHDVHAKCLLLGGSTSITGKIEEDTTTGRTIPVSGAEALPTFDEPTDIDALPDAWSLTLKQHNPDTFSRGGHRVCVPLAAADRTLGIMILGDRVSGLPYTTEETELLKTIGGHVAAVLLNIELSDHLLEAKQMEAFQTMSAFFVHDLKNTGTTLSLLLQNLPKHFEDPSFRDDALRSIGNGVDRINDLIGRLTLLREKLDIDPRPTDLNAFVGTTIEGLRAAVGGDLNVEPGDLPPVRIDPEQMQKVLTNLVLNADQATGENGSITVRTERDGTAAAISVVDNGCGMSEAFIHDSLFRPFQSTKKNGMGIGLFHSKMIVESHGGRIEVRSEEGKGTTFQVRIPLNGE